MLEAESRSTLRAFVKEKVAFAERARETENADLDWYFKSVVGTAVSKGRVPFRGVYLSHYPQADMLFDEVEKNANRAWSAIQGEIKPRDRLFVAFMRVGDNNPEDSIEVSFEKCPGGAMKSDAADQIARAGDTAGNNSFNAGAAVAMLETNMMLRGLVLRFMDDVRHITDQKISAESMITEMMSKLHVAEAMVEVMGHETEIRKVDRFFERMDPHISKYGQDVVDSMSVLAQGFSWKLAGGPSDPCPSKPGPATDWLIQRLAWAMNALGGHLKLHPNTITPKRKKQLEGLTETMVAAAVHFMDDDEDDDDA